MKITRTYLDSADEVLRVDEVTIEVSPPYPVMDLRAGSDPGLRLVIGPQEVKTIKVHTSGASGASRTVASINIIGDYDEIEEASGSFLWASKTLGNSQALRFDMSNLPAIGDTV
jgi:hypothetical protein